MILEGMYKSKLQNSAQLQTVLALYDQETARNKGKPNYSQLETAVKLHVDQMMRIRNFRVRNDVVERGSVHQESIKERKPTLRGQVGECFFSGTGQCSKGDSCSFSHDKPASGNSGEGQRRNGRSSSLASNRKAKQTDGEGQKPQRDQAIKRKALQTRVKFHANSNSAKTRLASSSILPCVSY